MRIRLVYSGGSHVISVSENISIRGLKLAITDALGDCLVLSSISCGYPPKLLDFPEETLISEHIHENEVLRLEVVQTSQPKRGKRAVQRTNSSVTVPRNTTMVSVNSEEDLFSKLETAIGPGKSKSKESKAFQSLFSQAVISRYDEAKAEARCAAIHSGKFSIEVTGNRSLRIEFWKGIGSRRDSTFSEEFPLLSRFELVQLLTLVYSDAESRTLLKEYEMSKFSARSFWNVVHHCGPDIHCGLISLCPSLDWSFLESRKRKKSQKAIEAEVSESKMSFQSNQAKLSTAADQNDVIIIDDGKEEEENELEVSDFFSDTSCAQDVDLLLNEYPMAAIYIRNKTNLTEVTEMAVEGNANDDLVKVVELARKKLISRMMLGVCEGNQADIDLLVSLRVSGPRALSLWYNREERLQKHLQKAVGDNCECWTLEKIELLTRRARSLLSEFDWLNRMF